MNAPSPDLNALTPSEWQSLCLHRAVAEKLRRHPALVELAVANLNRWKAAHGNESPDRSAWRPILNGPLEAILEAMIEPTARGIRLRKASPFPGILTASERLSILRECRAARGRRPVAIVGGKAMIDTRQIRPFRGFTHTHDEALELLRAGSFTDTPYLKGQP